MINPRVMAVTPQANYTLELRFTNHEVRIYDCSPLLNFGIFRQLQDRAYFYQAIVMNGTIAWPNEQDIWGLPGFG